MDPGRAEAQYEEGVCIEHFKNLEPRMENLMNIRESRLMTQTLSGCTIPNADYMWMHLEHSRGNMNTTR